MADVTPTTGRRALLAIAPVLATPVPAYPAGTVACDAFIVHLAAEWRSVREEEELVCASFAHALVDSADDRAGMAALDRIAVRLRDLVAQVADMPAGTLSGMQAKADMARHQLYLSLGEHADGPGDRLLYGLLDDLLRAA